MQRNEKVVIRKKGKYQKEFEDHWTNKHTSFLFDNNVLKTDYEKGKIIESYAVLDFEIDRILARLWTNFLVEILYPTEKSALGYELKNNWESHHILRVLHEVNWVNNNDIQKFKAFKSGRNFVIHELVGLSRNKKKKLVLDNQFLNGLKFYEKIKKKSWKTTPKEDKIRLEAFSTLLKESIKKERKKLEN